MILCDYQIKKYVIYQQWAFFSPASWKKNSHGRKKNLRSRLKALYIFYLPSEDTKNYSPYFLLL
jgi:hypothetical protein